MQVNNVKPILLITSRSLTVAEMKSLNKFCSVFEFDSDIHMNKTIYQFNSDILVIKLGDSKSRQYFGSVCSQYDFSQISDTIVWLRGSGDNFELDNLGGLKYRFTIKSVSQDSLDRVSFLNSMKGLYVPKVKKDNILKRVFRVVFKCFLN